ncbi:MAG: hypothetical protein KJ052_13925 [Candidatus Hydrogenedentes bacterium]|nr:hypothetical protein [Candidatus Hydrogenedentota bacterium]
MPVTGSGIPSTTGCDGTRTRWAETYAYDDGDNLTQRTLSRSDTFNEGTLGSFSGSGTWSAANGMLENSALGWLTADQAEQWIGTIH